MNELDSLFQFRKGKYKSVSLNELQKLYHDREVNPHHSKCDRFLAYNRKTKVWVAADNRTEDFFIDEFWTKKEALEWLIGY